jgi:hypothetical protein
MLQLVLLERTRGQLVPEDAWLGAAVSAAAVCEYHKQGNALDAGSMSAEDTAGASRVSCYCLLTYWSPDTSVRIVAGARDSFPLHGVQPGLLTSGYRG